MKKETAFHQWIRGPGNRVNAGLAVVSVLSMLIAAYSAHLSDRSLNQARDSFRIGQRPYVVVETIRLAELPNVDRPLAAEALIRNTGATPALNMQASQHLDVVSVPPTGVPHDFSPGSGRLVLGSNLARAIRVVGERPLTTEELQRVNSGKLRIYVTGTISYEDVFQRVHETEFCAFFDPGEKFQPLYLFGCPKLSAVR